MKTRWPLVLILLAALSTSCSLFKKPEDPLVRLIKAHQRLVDGTQAAKPSQQQQMMPLANEMQQMIDEAREGKPIDVEKADALVERSYRIY